jgi:hypothetical protein
MGTATVVEEQIQKYYAGIGSRETPTSILHLMQSISICMSNDGFTLRSGGAEGADSAFELGTSNKEIFLASDATGEAMEIAKQFHPAWNKLSYYVKKLMARNVMILLGSDLKTPVKCVICWTKDAKITGGTGHALKVASHYGIEAYNLADPRIHSRFLTYVEKNLK